MVANFALIHKTAIPSMDSVDTPDFINTDPGGFLSGELNEVLESGFPSLQSTMGR